MEKEMNGYVYILGDRNNDGIYKIGVTRGNVETRIKKLQTGNAGEIYLVKSHESHCPFFVERMFHKKYQFKNVMNEWFELTIDDLNNFELDCSKFEKLNDINEEIKKNMSVETY